MNRIKLKTKSSPFLYFRAYIFVVMGVAKFFSTGALILSLFRNSTLDDSIQFIIWICITIFDGLVSHIYLNNINMSKQMR